MALYKKLLELGIGQYPPEYNRKIHGSYDPARYYGKEDKALGDVKLGEIVGWINRRNKTPQAAMGVISRAWWRWQHKYMQPKRAGVAGLLQLVILSSAFFYLINYKKISRHKNYKYH